MPIGKPRRKIKEITIDNEIINNGSLLINKNHCGNVKVERFMIIPIEEEGKINLFVCVFNKPRDYTNLDINQLTLLF